MVDKQVKVPAGGKKITVKAGKLQVPDEPIIPFVEADAKAIGRNV